MNLVFLTLYNELKERNYTDVAICELFKVSSRMTLHRWKTKPKSGLTLDKYRDLCKIVSEVIGKDTKLLFMSGLTCLLNSEEFWM